MDWNLRLILLAVVLLLLLVIIGDGLWRARKKGGVKMRAKRKKPHNQGKDGDLADVADVLGPARVVTREGNGEIDEYERFAQTLQETHGDIDSEASHAVSIDADGTRSEQAHAPQTHDDATSAESPETHVLDDTPPIETLRVPTLREAERADEFFQDDVVSKKIDYHHHSTPETSVGLHVNETPEAAWQDKQQDLFTLESGDSAQSATSSEADSSSDTQRKSQSGSKKSRYKKKQAQKAKQAAHTQANSQANSQATSQTTGDDNASDAKAPDHMLVLFVSADVDAIDGKALLQLLVDNNCRLGEMNIFHRYEHTSGEGQSLFSVSNAVKPWKFNIKHMESDSYQGLCLLMNLPGAYDNMLPVFDEMAALAQTIADVFGAKVLDDKRSVINAQTLDHYRQSITDYQHKQRIHGH